MERQEVKDILAVVEAMQQVLISGRGHNLFVGVAAQDGWDRTMDSDDVQVVAREVVKDHAVALLQQASLALALLQGDTIDSADIDSIQATPQLSSLKRVLNHREDEVAVVSRTGSGG